MRAAHAPQGMRKLFTRSPCDRPGGCMKSTDVMVLGAGIVGVSAAHICRRRGRSVALIDRAGAAEKKRASATPA
ncbi:MAG: FAD-dependent oxidoreductase [Methylocystis sp.]